MTPGFHASMNESSQGRPVTFWISIEPGATDRSDDPVDAPPGSGSCHHDEPPASTGPTTRSGVFIPSNVLQILAVLVGGGVTGLLVTLQWPQAGAALGTICAIIGAGLPMLDLMRRRDGNASSGRGRA